MMNMIEKIQLEEEEKRRQRKIQLLKNPKKFRNDSRDFDADSVKDVLKEAFNRAMQNLLYDAEINYVIKELKKKDN
jgi:hypothetical protein